MIDDTPVKTRNIVGLGGYNYFIPASYIPTIKSSDYEYGYITRYFVGNINYSNITETNARGYNGTNSGFFKKTKITWKVSGVEFNVYKGKMLETTGVVDYNILRINQAAQVFPQISTILNNPRQFWRGF
jgi:hypothetical protein